MYVILMFRSLTASQRAARILQNRGIFGSVTKAPQSANPGGCTYGVKIASGNLQRAMTALAHENISPQKVLELNEGTAREVRQ